MIHQFKNNGFAFVVDTASGAVHSVDDVAYDVIALKNGGYAVTTEVGYLELGNLFKAALPENTL